jgi:hypothetical protein
VTGSQEIAAWAAARFALPLPDPPGARLEVGVALVRELRRHVPRRATGADGPCRWDADPGGLGDRDLAWWDPEWVATPTPRPPSEPKLIPVISTAPVTDPVELAQAYFRRWPVQENVIKDFLLPLGLDTNHGYAKTPVVNSEVAKRRASLERRLTNAQRWAARARARCERAQRRAERLRPRAKARSDELYRELAPRTWALEAQGVPTPHLRGEARALRAAADAEIAALWAPVDAARRASDEAFRKVEQYCRRQRELLRALADLAASERAMYQLDDAKDQVMTVCKVALANLVMWARGRFFPASYARATWGRLAPFFRLPGRVLTGPDRVRVELRPFNDRRLTRDLVAVCARVGAARPRLPDGRALLLTVGAATGPTFGAHTRPVA